MKAVIFLGPSLPLHEAKAILPEAIYLPPAGQADLLSAVTKYHPDVIGLIDGVFSQSLSVWHKEILYALEQGIHVYGASSMGALRATETDRFGMIGVGRVYEMYRDGILTDDDEVALIHSQADDGYITFSEPMVNLRLTFQESVAAGLIDQHTCDTLIQVAKDLYYPDRTFPRIFRTAHEARIPSQTLDTLRTCVKDHYVDIKKQDAIDLLKTIRDLPETLPKAEVDFELTRSHLFEALYQRDRTVSHNGVDIRLGSIARYVTLHKPDFLTFNFNALNRVLVLVLAELYELEITEEAVEKEIRRFRIRHHLNKKTQFQRWLTENDLSEEEFTELMREQALCRRLQYWLLTKLHLKGNVKVLLDALRLEDQYTEWADKAAAQEEIIKEHYPQFLQTDHDHITLEELMIAHLRETDCRMDVHYSTWLKEAGYDSGRHLWFELLRAKLARDYLSDEE